MLHRPTTDECIRYGARAALARAYGRRRIPGRGPGGRRSSGGGGAAWTPARLFGVGESDGAWWDSSTVTLVGSDVDVWPDLSPHGHDATAPSASTRPSYTSSDADFGSRPSLTFASGSAERVRLALDTELDLAADEAVDLVAIHKISGVIAAGWVFSKRTTDGYLFNENSSTGLGMVYDTTTGAGSPAETYTTAGVTRGDVLLHRAYYDPSVGGGSSAVLINGTSSSLVTTGQGGSPSNAVLGCIGGRHDGAALFDGKMVFVLVRIGLSLTADERTSLLDYLNARFGQSFAGI